MKNSAYNLILPLETENDEYIIFNTLSNSLLLADGELAGAIEDRRYDLLDENTVSAMKAGGIFIEDETDEKMIFSKKYREILDSSEELRFVIITTYKCNLACSYCYEGRGTVVSEDMSPEIRDKAIEAIKKRALPTDCKSLKIMLFGGEPLMNPDTGLVIMKELSRWCGENGLKYEGSMVTNGTLATRDLVDKFRPYISTVQLTLDGPKEYHDGIRVFKNGSGTYGKVMDAIKAFRSAGIFVALRIQVNENNVGLLDTLKEELDRNGIAADKGIRQFPSLIKKYSEFCNMDCELLEDCDPAVLSKILEFEKNMKPSARFVPCHIYANMFVIDPAGDVYKCITEVAQKENVLGTVKNGRLELSGKYSDFMSRDPLGFPECAQCSYLPVCGGGCPYMARKTNGTCHSSFCGMTKEVVEQKLTGYMEGRR
ncbi:Radical SAM domain protein [Methanolacinia petrolearia DSM 11571]|uniref:Radical SAM domain protein n=1 Tax=Methanolacinia petrolearia (strain DSM 11571 / OCM 486 / SEBR 4847) TaxID=679926 RepID=E1RF35_METP4|nr:radical SAM protein [Methanolacinia petrolearia]ADN37279.1 Radical SAM domain protein [Methanolacinia petrolearia DSM 11571]